MASSLDGHYILLLMFLKVKG